MKQGELLRAKSDCHRNLTDIKPVHLLCVIKPLIGSLVMITGTLDFEEYLS